MCGAHFAIWMLKLLQSGVRPSCKWGTWRGRPSVCPTAAHAGSRPKSISFLVEAKEQQASSCDACLARFYPTQKLYVQKFAVLTADDLVSLDLTCRQLLQSLCGLLRVRFVVHDDSKLAEPTARQFVQFATRILQSPALWVCPTPTSCQHFLEW